MIHTRRCVMLVWLVLVGTAQPSQAAQQPNGLPRETQAMLDELYANVEQRANLAQLMAHVHELRQQADALDRQGERQAAARQRAHARELILGTDEAVFYQPGLHALFLELTRAIDPDESRRMLPLLNQSPPLWASNPQVRAFVRYYQSKGRRLVQTAWQRLAGYEAMMRRVFREEGVPEELIYVGLVESAYNPYARSVAGAHGIWQFMPVTAKKYGLKQSGQEDERQHPEKSTRAAAQYLRDLYQLLGDWPLVLASYNAGEYRILRALRKTGANDFWQLSGSGLLPKETVNYVPSVLAAILLSQHRPSLVSAGAPANQRSKE